MRMKLAFCISVFFLFTSFTFGQNLPKKTDDKSTEIKQTTKIDEFGDISEKEISAKLKKFAEMLDKNNSATGYIIFYNDFNSTPFRKTQHFAEAKIKSYLKYVQYGAYDSPRVGYSAGGLREKMTTELWIVPAGEEFTEISNTLNYLKNEKYRLDRLETKYIPVRQLYQEHEKDEKGIKVDIDKNLLERKLLNGFYSDPEDFFETYVLELSGVLKRNQSWQAKIFLYADKDEFDIQTLQSFIENQLKTNFEKSDSNVNQIKVIYGGYRSHPQIDTWIIPQGGIEPEAMPDEKIKEN